MAWVIAGLGNPGEEYENTRHNAGRMALEYFAERADIWPLKEDKKRLLRVGRGSIGKSLVVLVAPDTFMNKSGQAVAPYVTSAKAAEKLVVLYDDLDLPLGKIKVSFDRGSGGHKGVESIIRAVHTKKFVRIRIGVSPATPAGKLKKPHGEKEVLDFILGKFKAAEMDTLKRVFKRVDVALQLILSYGYVQAMNEIN